MKGLSLSVLSTCSPLRSLRIHLGKPEIVTIRSHNFDQKRWVDFVQIGIGEGFETRVGTEYGRELEYLVITIRQ